MRAVQKLVMVCVAFAAACGGRGDRRDRADRTLTWKPAAIGDAWTVEEHGTSRATLSLSDGARTVDSVRDKKVEVEVLEVAGDVPARLRARFEVARQTQTQGSRSRDVPSPLQGQTYQVWLDGGKVAASRDDGAAVGDDELEELGDELRGDLGEIPPMSRVLISRTWKADEVYPLDAGDLAILNEADPKMTIERGTVTFRGGEADVALFDLRLEARMTGEGSEGTVTLEVAARIDAATARTREGKIHGVVKGIVSGTGIDAVEDGLETRTYRAPG